MLSRVAESVYWMFRYMERAQNMSRFIDADFNNLLYDPDNKENAWRSLIAVTGDQAEYEKRYDAYTQANIVRFLTLDGEYLNSVLSSLVAARENARSVREIISSEMWETINGLYLLACQYADKGFGNDPSAFCKAVHDGGFTFTGLFYSTMNRGDAWHFARMGMLGERADKTTRILDVKYYILLPQEQLGGAFDRMQWSALLKSASGLEMYRKKYRATEPLNVMEFLLFDAEFPRSVKHCCRYLYESLGAVCGNPRFSGVAAQTIEPLLHDLSNLDIGQVVNLGMHEYIDELQARLNAVGQDISEAFFGFNPTIKQAGPQHGHQGCA